MLLEFAYFLAFWFMKVVVIIWNEMESFRKLENPGPIVVALFGTHCHGPM
jgi:hypothetical protein